MSSSPTGREPFKARVQFTLQTTLRKSYGANDFLQSVFGKILARCDNDEQESCAGYITGSLVQFGRALDHGIARQRHIRPRSRLV